MINNLLKNFCLIIFALIAPITLPAGGIQKSLNQNRFFNKTKEITLSSNTSLYSFPEISIGPMDRLIPVGKAQYTHQPKK